ncbi:MAG: MarR family winged helix-turn-helix transcriptional regulator [Romboutsia sp.]
MEQNGKEPIGRYVSQLYRKGNSFVSKELCEYGIGSGQIMFLIALYRQDGISQEELSEILNIDKGTTARALKKLEEENFVIRLKDEFDKRAYKIYLTNKSKEVRGSFFKVLEQWNDIVESTITHEESEALINILKKICINQNIK